jgi:hypothetical protein
MRGTCRTRQTAPQSARTRSGRLHSRLTPRSPLSPAPAESAAKAGTSGSSSGWNSPSGPVAEAESGPSVRVRYHTANAPSGTTAIHARRRCVRAATSSTRTPTANAMPTAELAMPRSRSTAANASPRVSSRSRQSHAPRPAAIGIRKLIWIGSRRFCQPEPSRAIGTAATSASPSPTRRRTRTKSSTTHSR